MNKNQSVSVPCSLETRVSEKSGKEYQVFVIKITENIEKVVFPEKAELELLKLTRK